MTAPDGTDGFQQTAPEKQLRKTIEDVQTAIGSLPDGYNEPEALRLIKALGRCDAFVAPALNHLHTTEQESARRRFHKACAELSTAIRQAVGYPGRSEHERRVVELAAELKSSASTVQMAFGW